MAKKSERSEEKQLETLKEIKKLLILQLIISEVSVEDIGKTLGVSSRTIQRLVSTRETKKRKKSVKS